MIAKFDGHFLDWPRFCEKFLETIDKTSVTAIVKFSYLRKLLDSKAKRKIEALSFTPEGYNRTKSILLEKYGKKSEIIEAYTEEIFDLPTVPNASPKKTCEFSEKLTSCVQILQKINKLEQLNGAASMTLDKLPAIRGDLVHTVPNWEKWDSAQLFEAICLQIRRNHLDTSQRK